MDWVDIGRLIEAEQKRHNPVAEMIKLPLKLHENTVTLLLSEMNEEEEDETYGSETESEPSDSDDENDSDTKTKPTKKNAAPEEKRLAIDIDLALSPWANAKQYFDQKKTAVVKEEKTLQASSKALKSAEQKIAADLKKGLKQEKEVLRSIRKQFWFEKFLYFISSDGYLVLGGKDAQQNELLYRRYLRKGDIYVHADLNGAASVIIKNNPATPDAPIPPSTLSQAGNYSVSTSNAWDSKAVMSAWWVNSDQVSKTAPTGEYLSTGGFMIRGKKNFLPPAQLLLGFAIMYQISEESKARHVKHRVVSSEAANSEEHSGDAEAVSAADFNDDNTQENGNKGGEDDEGEDDDDEDFPDAKIENAESDDEDFPDAKLEGNNSDEEDEDHTPSFNPLQSNQPSQDKDETEEEDDDDDEQDGDGQQEEASTTEPTQEGTNTPSSKPGPRHLSARERRLLRKGIDPSTPSVTATDSEAELSATEATNTAAPAASATPSTTTTTPQQKQKTTPLPRGKRTKAKKLAAKYANQDEEDRELAMRILGSTTGQQKAEDDAAARRAKEEEAAAQKRR
ncbi:hypothetical protein LTS18_010008, partial [Coniosporium uncinatum]